MHPVDVRCDVYGLGAVGLALLADELVVDPHGLEHDEFLRRKSMPFDPPADMPSSLAAILVKALAPKASQRYPSAEQFAQDLDRYLNWRPVEAFEGQRQIDTKKSFTVACETTQGSNSDWLFVVSDIASRETVGSLRIRDLREAMDEGEENCWLGVSLPFNLLPLCRLLDEVSISEAARGTEAASALLGAVFERELQTDSLLTFLASSPARYPEQLRLGFRTVGRVVRTGDGSYEVPMVMVNHDLAHLVQLGSPLAAVLRTHGRFDDRRGLNWIASQLESVEYAQAPPLPLRSQEEVASPLLVGISTQGRQEILREATRKLGGQGDTLIDAGELGSWIALVESGLVEIVVGGEVVAVRGEGELVGEMGFLLGKSRTACVVVAAPETSLIILHPESVTRQLTRSSDRERLWRNLATILAHKLEAQTKYSSHR